MLPYVRSRLTSWLVQSLPSPAGPAQHTESLRGIRALAISLAERAGRGDHTGEVCHWADGYHLNVRIYEKLLMSVFDILDEGQLVEVRHYTQLLSDGWCLLSSFTEAAMMQSISFQRL